MTAVSDGGPIRVSAPSTGNAWWDTAPRSGAAGATPLRAFVLDDSVSISGEGRRLLEQGGVATTSDVASVRYSATFLTAPFSPRTIGDPMQAAILGLAWAGNGVEEALSREPVVEAMALSSDCRHTASLVAARVTAMHPADSTDDADDLTDAEGAEDSILSAAAGASGEPAADTGQSLGQAEAPATGTSLDVAA